MHAARMCSLRASTYTSASCKNQYMMDRKCNACPQRQLCAVDSAQARPEQVHNVHRKIDDCRVYLIGGAQAKGTSDDTVVVYTPSVLDHGIYMSNITLTEGMFWSDVIEPPGASCCLHASTVAVPDSAEAPNSVKG